MGSAIWGMRIIGPHGPDECQSGTEKNDYIRTDIWFQEADVDKKYAEAS